MKNTYTEIRPDKATLPKNNQKVIFKFSKGGYDYVLEGKYSAKEEQFDISEKEKKAHKLRTNFFFWFEVNEWKPVKEKRKEEVQITTMEKILGKHIVQGASETFVRFTYERLEKEGIIVKGVLNEKLLEVSTYGLSIDKMRKILGKHASPETPDVLLRDFYARCEKEGSIVNGKLDEEMFRINRNIAREQ